MFAVAIIMTLAILLMTINGLTGLVDGVSFAFSDPFAYLTGFTCIFAKGCWCILHDGFCVLYLCGPCDSHPFCRGFRRRIFLDHQVLNAFSLFFFAAVWFFHIMFVNICIRGTSPLVVSYIVNSLESKHLPFHFVRTKSFGISYRLTVFYLSLTLSP